MRFLRLSRHGSARYGLVRDQTVHLIDRAPFDGYDETGETVPLRAAELLTPVEPATIFCVGRNYLDHIAEMGYPVPTSPNLFLKPATTLVPTGGTVVLPPKSVSSEVEHEAELAVVVGAVTRNVSPEQALSHVFGYTVADDISARDLQRADGNNMRGKCFDTFCPLGPWVETDLDPTSGVAIRCRVNDELRQDGTTTDLVFGVPYLVSYLSAFATLLPGDLILTGSPGGCGPLNPGDQVEIEVAGIGRLVHDVAANDVP